MFDLGGNFCDDLADGPVKKFSVFSELNCMKTLSIFLAAIFSIFFNFTNDAWAESYDQLTKLQRLSVDTGTSLSVMGIRRAFATAYQSCQSLKLPPMRKDSPDLEGIEDLGSYPGSWTGRILKISDQAAVARTHYYIKDFAPSTGCVDVKKKSMIYDFGGKPYTTSAVDSTLNYWKTNGDGGAGLGIDCSGFVFTSLAAGGLRLREGKQMKASEVENYPARSYMDPVDSGYTCLAKAKMGKKSGWIQPGDIMATKYHVAIVERVGEDPFGILKNKDCDISYKDFDFVIAQSSPDQNNVGINKYEAREYLSIFKHFQFKNGLEEYAKNACEAYYQGKETVTNSSSFSVVRHKMTPGCLQPEIKLDGQSCIQSCPEFFE